MMEGMSCLLVTKAFLALAIDSRAHPVDIYHCEVVTWATEASLFSPHLHNELYQTGMCSWDDTCDLCECDHPGCVQWQR